MLTLSAEQQNMVKAIANRCCTEQIKVATAESCTGGLVAALFTSQPGSSEWFTAGFVTYSNEAKQAMVGVSHKTLEHYGAVSEETAGEMAQGAVAHSDADISLSITGIAGPEGGSNDKPVGTVCFGWAKAGDKPKTDTRLFEGDRASVREQSVQYALEKLLEQMS